MEFDTEKCGCCGACVTVCPNNSLELTESQIIIESNKCDDCGRCKLYASLGAFTEEEVGETPQNPMNHQIFSFLESKNEI